MTCPAYTRLASVSCCIGLWPVKAHPGCVAVRIPWWGSRMQAGQQPPGQLPEGAGEAAAAGPGGAGSCPGGRPCSRAARWLPSAPAGPGCRGTAARNCLFSTEYGAGLAAAISPIRAGLQENSCRQLPVQQRVRGRFGSWQQQRVGQVCKRSGTNLWQQSGGRFAGCHQPQQG